MRFSTTIRTAALALALTSGAALSNAFADSVTNMSAPNQTQMAANEQLALASDPAQVTSAQANAKYEMNIRKSPDDSSSYDHGW